MKNPLILTVFLFITVFSGLIGCANMQKSSIMDALDVTEHQPDFKKHVLAVNMSSGISPLVPTDPFIKETIPEIDLKPLYVVYLIIYITVDDYYKIIFLDDELPPKIVGERIFR